MSFKVDTDVTLKKKVHENKNRKKLHVQKSQAFSDIRRITIRYNGM